MPITNPEQLKELYWEQKLPLHIVGRKLGISRSAVHRRMMKYGIKRRTRWETHIGRRREEKERKFRKEWNEEMFYILGVLWGDGYWRIEKDGTGRIGLNTTSGEFAHSFADSLKQIGLRPNIMCRKNNGYKQGYIHEVIGYSRPMANWLLGLTLNDIVSNMTTNTHRTAFLRGLYESEGHLEERFLTWNNRIYPTYQLSITNGDKELVDIIIYLMQLLGYTPKLYREANIYQVRLYAKEAIRSFINEINPCIRTKELLNN